MVTMAVQMHKYWFVYWIDPKRNIPIIYKTDFPSQYQTDAWARNFLGTKGIKYGVKGEDTCGSEVYGRIKAEAIKLSGDTEWAGRSSHILPNPEDIVTE